MQIDEAVKTFWNAAERGDDAATVSTATCCVLSSDGRFSGRMHFGLPSANVAARNRTLFSSRTFPGQA